MALSPKVGLSISTFSNAVFPSLTQNLTQIRCSFKSPLRTSRTSLKRYSNTHWETAQKTTAAIATSLTLKIAIIRHLLKDSCNYCLPIWLLLARSGISGYAFAHVCFQWQFSNESYNFWLILFYDSDRARSAFVEVFWNLNPARLKKYLFVKFFVL